jgi:hypothetical protein
MCTGTSPVNRGIARWVSRVRLARLRQWLPELFCAEPCHRGEKNGSRREAVGKCGDWSRSAGRELKIVAPPLRLRLRPALSILCSRGPRAELEVAGVERGGGGAELEVAGR